MRRLQWQHQNNVVQDLIEFSLSWFEDRNYTLTVDVDMRRWVRTMSQAPSTAMVNPTFDPRHSRLSPEDSFWLDVRVGSQTIAMMAGRLFITDDYFELKRTMRLWYEHPRPCDVLTTMSLPAGTPVIRGRVGHEGGLWVHPEHRKRGLSVVVPHLLRALCLRQWDIDWQTGVTMRGVGESGIATRAYGVPHVVPCYEGYFPAMRRHDRLFSAYMSRDEILAGSHLDAITRLLPDRYSQVGRSLALA